VDALVAHVAAEQHLVAGAERPLAALGAEKAISEVWCWPQLLVQPEMLARRPPTSARPSALEPVADGGAQATAHVQPVAGVGTGARDDVAHQLGAGLGHADGVEPLVQDGSCSSVRPRRRRSGGW
jgi:hypothetical protein